LNELTDFENTPTGGTADDPEQPVGSDATDGVDDTEAAGDPADPAGVPTAAADDDEDTDEDLDEDDDDPNAHLIEEGDVAADYLERFLDIVDYDGDIDLDVENDRAVVAIVGSGLKALIGPHGETLDALQELTRLAVAQKTGNRSRLMLDVSGHRSARRAELARLANDTAAQVLSSGEAARLSPMNPFERKVVHDAIAGVDGVRSESEGEEPSRRVVVLPER
jgi:spoIIIJ-associated protein